MGPRTAILGLVLAQGCCCPVAPRSVSDVRVQLAPEHTLVFVDPNWGCTFDDPPSVTLDGRALSKRSDGGGGLSGGGGRCVGPSFEGAAIDRADLVVWTGTDRVALPLRYREPGVTLPARMKATPGGTLSFAVDDDRDLDVTAELTQRREGSLWRGYGKASVSGGTVRLALPADLPRGRVELALVVRATDPSPAGCPWATVCAVETQGRVRKAELRVR